jgi:hypothetical protein
MSSSSTGKVENSIPFFKIQIVGKRIHKQRRFSMVSVFVKYVVIWRVEPRSVPIVFFFLHSYRFALLKYCIFAGNLFKYYDKEF